MMEEEEDDGKRINDVEKRNGKTFDQEKLHAFPISSGTIFF
jgi:hypothetical protein